MKQRLNYIDSIKGFAIICVVIGHVVNGYTKAGLLSKYTYLLDSLYYVVESFHMPLFVIVSGYLFKKAYCNNEGVDKKKVKQQVINLYWTYIIFSLLWVLFKALLSTMVNTKLSIVDAIAFPIKPIDHYWYLFVLCIMYIVFSARAINQCKKSVLLVLLIFINLLSFFIPWIEWLSLNRSLYYPLFFFLGMVLCEYKIPFSYPVVIISFIAFGISVSICLYCGLRGHAVNAIPIVNTFVGGSLGLFFFYWFSNIRLFSREGMLSQFGKCSLYIYIFHGYFTAGGRIVLSKLFGGGYGIAQLIVCIVISLFFPIIIKIMLEVIKLHDLLFKPYSNLISKGIKRNE